MENNNIEILSPDELKKADGKKVCIVWYEDRFGFGADGDPASPVNAFLTKKEAEDYIESDMGPIDTSSGKFDGLFAQEWEFLHAIERGVIKILRSKELLAQLK